MDYRTFMQKHPEVFNDLDAPIKILLEQNVIDTWKKERSEELKNKSLPSEWTEIGVVFDDPFIVILRDLVEFPGGYQNGFIRMYYRSYLEGGAAGVVMLPEMNEKILVFQHYRHATRAWHWEFPRGFGKAGRDAKAQAKHELNHEIGGAVVGELIDLGMLYNNTGLEGNPVNLFLAHMESVGEMETNEGIRNPLWVSTGQLEQMIADSEVTDSFTIAAYTRAKLKGLI